MQKDPFRRFCYCHPEFYEHGERLRRFLRELVERQPDVIEEERELIDTERSDAFQDRSAQKIAEKERFVVPHRT